MKALILITAAILLSCNVFAERDLFIPDLNAVGSKFHEKFLGRIGDGSVLPEAISIELRDGILKGLTVKYPNHVSFEIIEHRLTTILSGYKK